VKIMKIILLEDVYKQGVAGDVVDVAPGYARNYLIPRGMAVKASTGMLRRLENLRKQAEVRRAQRDQEYGQIAEQVEGLTLYFSVKASEGGKLYGSVTNAQIAEQLAKHIGLEIDRRRIGDRPLRELGEFDVPVRLDAGLAPAIKVVVFREGEDPRLMTEEELEAAAEAKAAETEAEEMQVEALEEVEAEAEEVAAEEEEAEALEEAEAEAEESAAEEE
jgi:large subunit ribosomal protein L9